jgi:NAD(P)-dependent dehydrogenase (short-subunit alcohol dehydrogenase family)
MQGTGIHVVLIEPGPIASKLRQNAIPHFERWIDWKASARRDEYQAILHRLYGPGQSDRFELPPTAVTERLMEALDSPRPAARLYVTAPTHVVGALRRVLPSKALHWVMGRV